MLTRKSGGMRLRSVDYIYVLLAGIAGVWQSWCFNYGSDRFLILLIMLMSLPFALASYGYALFLSTTGTQAQRPDWTRIPILWAGMPFCLIVASATILAETKIMLAAGFGIVNLPFDDLRVLIGEGAACLAWAVCLLIWSQRAVLRPSATRLFALFAALFAGVLVTYGLSTLILRRFQKDYFILSTSIITTIISALLLVFLNRKGQGAQEVASGAKAPFRPDRLRGS
jgi:hypothetical protein